MFMPYSAAPSFSRGFGAERMCDVDFVRNSAINIFEYNSDDGRIIAIKTNITEHLDASLVSDVPKALKN